MPVRAWRGRQTVTVVAFPRFHLLRSALVVVLNGPLPVTRSQPNEAGESPIGDKAKLDGVRVVLVQILITLVRWLLSSSNMLWEDRPLVSALTYGRRTP